MLVGRLGFVYDGCGGVKTAERIPPVLNAPNSRREIYAETCQRTSSTVMWQMYLDIPFRIYFLGESLRNPFERWMKRVRTRN